MIAAYLYCRSVQEMVEVSVFKTYIGRKRSLHKSIYSLVLRHTQSECPFLNISSRKSRERKVRKLNFTIVPSLHVTNVRLIDRNAARMCASIEYLSQDGKPDIQHATYRKVEYVNHLHITAAKHAPAFGGPHTLGRIRNAEEIKNTQAGDPKLLSKKHGKRRK